MNFDDLLTRADDETLQTLLGSSSVRLVKLLDPASATPARLRELLLHLRAREDLLLRKESRDLLLDLLRPSEASHLASELRLTGHADVYEAIKSVGLRSGSANVCVLFNFFGLDVPEAVGREEPPSHEPAASGYQLFAHQRRAAREIKEQLTRERRRVLLHMPTGSGKTRTAVNIVADTLRSREPTAVIWLAHSEELCEQAATEFGCAWRQLGDRQVSLYRFWGGHQLDPDDVRDGLVVAGLSKVFRAAKRSTEFISKLGSRCSLVVIDEAHQAVAETYKMILDVLMETRSDTALLGLTATPGRTWADINADAELADFFARRKVTLSVPGYDNPVSYLIDEGYLARPAYRSLFHQSGITLSPADLKSIQEELEIPPGVLARLAADEQRNLRIVLEIETLIKRHSRILVFAATVEHAKLLSAVLRARGHAADYLTGDTHPAERERIIRGFKSGSPESRILCNYEVLTTGFDAPRTSSAVIARPTESLVLYSQMVGRATRGVKAGGNREAEIVTVVDTDLPGFGGIAESFSNWEDVWRQDDGNRPA